MAVLERDRLQLDSAEWFRTKLQYETTPHGLEKIKHLPTLLIVDVRPRDAYAKEHIPGAVNIPLEELQNRMGEVGRDKTVICYCWNITCSLATKASLLLAESGYKVQELMGGIDRWKVAGFEVEGGTKTVNAPQ